MKKSLSFALGPGVELTYGEMVTLLAQISCSINSCPLGLQNTSDTGQLDDMMIPLTPNQLLIGRSMSEPPSMEFSKDDRYTVRQAYVQQLHQNWWEKWSKEVFPTLIPCKRWRDPQRNLQQNDIVMMKYPGQVKDDYRIAKVVDVFPDDKGRVRTVKVAYRRKDRREPSHIYWKKPLVEEVVAVQRLALLQAAGEDQPTGSCVDELPLDRSQRAAQVKASFVSLDALRDVNMFG